MSSMSLSLTGRSRRDTVCQDNCKCVFISFLIGGYLNRNRMQGVMGIQRFANLINPHIVLPIELKEQKLNS